MNIHLSWRKREKHSSTMDSKNIGQISPSSWCSESFDSSTIEWRFHGCQWQFFRFMSRSFLCFRWTKIVLEIIFFSQWGISSSGSNQSIDWKRKRSDISIVSHAWERLTSRRWSMTRGDLLQCVKGHQTENCKSKERFSRSEWWGERIFDTQSSTLVSWRRWWTKPEKSIEISPSMRSCSSPSTFKGIFNWLSNSFVKESSRVFHRDELGQICSASSEEEPSWLIRIDLYWNGWNPLLSLTVEVMFILWILKEDRGKRFHLVHLWPFSLILPSDCLDVLHSTRLDQRLKEICLDETSIAMKGSLSIRLTSNWLNKLWHNARFSFHLFSSSLMNSLGQMLLIIRCLARCGGFIQWVFHWSSRWRMFVCTNLSPSLRQSRPDQDQQKKTLPRLHSIPSFTAGWSHFARDIQRLGGRDTLPLLLSRRFYEARFLILPSDQYLRDALSLSLSLVHHLLSSRMPVDCLQGRWEIHASTMSLRKFFFFRHHIFSLGNLFNLISEHTVRKSSRYIRYLKYSTYKA